MGGLLLWEPLAGLQVNKFRAFCSGAVLGKVSIVNRLRNRNTALTSAELCELIHVHPVTLRGWTRAGRIPAYRMGREWRYDPGKVADWLDEREVGLGSCTG